MRKARIRAWYPLSERAATVDRTTLSIWLVKYDWLVFGIRKLSPEMMNES